MKSGMKLVLAAIPYELCFASNKGFEAKYFYDTTGLLEQYAKEDRAVLGYNYSSFGWRIHLTKAQICEAAAVKDNFVWVKPAKLNEAKALIRSVLIQDKLKEASTGNPDKLIEVTTANVLLFLREDELADFPAKIAAMVEETKRAADAWKSEREPQKESGQAGCFIATAVYGSYDAPNVRILRKYRDAVLQKTVLGRSFIHFYYRAGPTLAKHLNGHKRISLLMRRILDCFVVSLKRKFDWQ